MQKIRKLFGGIEMTWPKVIIMALVTAVYTALINQVPALKDTSFQDIAVNLFLRRASVCLSIINTGLL